jgi:glutaminase
LPAKSGIGGGIVAVLPGEMSVYVWSPGLDANGNSLAGVLALE